MSDMLINAYDARLSIIGYQPEVKRIYWSALPNKLPTFGQTLDLSGCEIKAIYADGSEAVVTDYCTFSPDSGYTVPNERTLTVTATYTARSGKVCEADEVLPICTLDHIRIIIPHSVPEYTKEQWRECGSIIPTAEEYARMFGFGDIYVAAYWTEGGQLRKVTRLNLNETLSSPCLSHSAVYETQEGPDILIGYAALLRRTSAGENITFNRYYDFEHSESVTYEHAFKLEASLTWNGLTYTDEAYLSADACVGYRMINPPTAYSGTEEVEISSRDTSVWVLDYSYSGEQPLGVFYPYVNRAGPAFFFPAGQSYVSHVPWPGFSNQWSYAARFTFVDGASGRVKKTDYPARVNIDFSCDDGIISWVFQSY